MSLDQTILAIKREFSGQEKYRLFLQHLNTLEDSLRAERDKATRLTKANAFLVSDNNRLIEEIKDLKASLAEYDKSEIGKSCVKLKTHEKAVELKKQWEALYIEKCHKVQDLEKKLKEMYDHL